MRPSARTCFDVALVLLFGLGSIVPVGVWLARGEPRRRRLPEERPIAVFPAWPASLSDVSAFPAGIEAWFGDRLGGRDELLRARSRILVHVFDVAPTPRIELGPGRSVYLTDGRALDVARGVDPMSFADLESWRIALDARAGWCRERGIVYIFAIPPEKPAIYPEGLPAGRTVLGPSRLDQLVAHVRARGHVEFLDWRADLASERTRDTDGDHVYFRLGTHWTDRGAWRAYSTLIERLRARHPELAAKPQASLHWVSSEALGDSWAERLYLAGDLVQTERHVLDLPEKSVRLVEASGAIGDHVVYETDDPSAPRLLMLHDSYGEPLRRLLPSHFSRSVFEWGRDFRPEAIEKERPDVVLEVLAERVLARRPAQTLPAQAASIQDAFERATDVVYRLDPARDAAFFAARGGVRVAPDPLGLAIEWTSDGTGLAVPALPAAVDVIVRIDLTVPADMGLTIYYLTASESDYSRARSLGFGLHAGRNVLHADLSVADRRGPLLVRFGRRGETAMLHALEARLIR